MARRASDRALCRPALVWDVRALHALDDPAAESFIQAFGNPSQEPEVPDTSTHPLLLAARIVVLERQGKADEAKGLYPRLAGNPWRELLRLCIGAWAPSGDRESIEDARSHVIRMRDRDLRPRVLAKLAAVAFDKNESEIGISLVEEAIAEAPKPSRLAWALDIVRANATGTMPRIRLSVGRLPDDPLVDQSWIEEEASGGLREQINEMLAGRAQNPWSGTFRIGRTAVDRIVAAEVQATWAGALWTRPALRKQAGAQIMLTGTSTPEQLSYGFLMWLLGGGDNRKPIANWLEPKLRESDLAQLISFLVRGGDPAGRVQSATVDVCQTWWDCLSSPVVALVLDAFPPGLGKHPQQADVRQLWALLAPCGHDIWKASFLSLDKETMAAVAALMNPRTIERLPDDVVSAIDQALGEELPERELTVSSNPLLVKLAAAKRTGSTPPAISVEELTPGDLLEIAEYAPESVSEEDLVAGAEALARAIEQAIEDARTGSFGFGGPRPEALLGDYILLLGRKGSRYIRVLEKAVMTPFYGGEARLAALGALATIRLRKRKLPAKTLDALRKAPVETPAVEFRAVGPDLLQAGKFLVLFDQLTAEDEALLIALARSDDARVRQLAINAAGLAYRTGGEHPALESALASALFDPEPEVIARGLVELQHRQPDELLLLVERRLKILVTAFSRQVRAAAVRLARRLLEKEADPALAEVVELARHDKSWQVRRVATEEVDQVS